jgi:KDO2-lipid IV(A) lauroyltransferase
MPPCEHRDHAQLAGEVFCLNQRGVTAISNVKKIRHRLELLGVKILVALPTLLPLKLSVRLGGVLGNLAFDIFRIRRKVTLQNLERAFGSRFSDRERIGIGRRSYVNFAKSMVEFASIGRLSKDTLRSIVTIHGHENLKEGFDGGRGIIAVTGHFGSWELLGAASVASGIPVDFLVGEQSNSLVDDLMNDLRRRAGIGTIARGIAVRGVIESLKRNRIVALLSDQDARKMGVFVDFMGTPASTFQGAAQFAYRMKCPIVCCGIIRNPDETHDAYFLAPITPRSDSAKADEVLRLTQEHTKALEDFVGRYPDQYFWAHRRWKTEPP